ncbi:MAG: nucleoside deaminase [Rikenellaceae bacterium]|nr:nucleoside deaminase [Rikenellaceae bacterium]
MYNEEYMREAIELARNSVAGGGGPFGAVIVREGKVIASATNSVTLTGDPTAHAEVNAIREACRAAGDFKLEGAEIYTSCEPCPMCLGALYWAGISKIYYGAGKHDAAEAGFDDSFIYDEMSLPYEERSIPAVQLLRDEAKGAFALWNEKSDKVEY